MLFLLVHFSHRISGFVAGQGGAGKGLDWKKWMVKETECSNVVKTC
jgi:hypothetical protein